MRPDMDGLCFKLFDDHFQKVSKIHSDHSWLSVGGENQANPLEFDQLAVLSGHQNVEVVYDVEIAWIDDSTIENCQLLQLHQAGQFELLVRIHGADDQFLEILICRTQEIKV